MSIRTLKAIHAATHPGKMPEAGKALAEPTAEDLLEALAMEAAEEGE